MVPEIAGEAARAARVRLAADVDAVAAGHHQRVLHQLEDVRFLPRREVANHAPGRQIGGDEQVAGEVDAAIWPRGRGRGGQRLSLEMPVLVVRQTRQADRLDREAWVGERRLRAGRARPGS